MEQQQTTNTQKQIRNILFDFDGTLVDTAPGITSTMRQVFLRMGKPVPSEEAMRATIGIPLGKALSQLANLDSEGEKEAVDLYRSLFVQYELGNLSVYPNVISTLEKMHDAGLRLAIVTSRDENSLNLIVKPRHMDRFFETRVTASDGLPAKPAPDLVLALLQRMGIEAEETLVVGDTTFDIEMGNRAGCRTCALTYGNHDRQTLLTARPTYIIDDFASLLNITSLEQ